MAANPNPNGNAADPLTSAPQKRRPVLFVHGHNPDDANDADFNAIRDEPAFKKLVGT